MRVKNVAMVVVFFFVLIMLNGCSGGSQSGSGSKSGTTSLSALQLSPNSSSIASGATQNFTATGTFSDGSSRDMTASVQWSSSDSGIATVDNTGVATGLGIGVVVITAQSGSVAATATLSVTNAADNLTAITLSPLASTMPVNTAQQFTASGTYSDGSSRDLTALVAWNSSSAAAATINTNGVAVGVSAGTTTISATLGSVTGSTTLTITAPTITAVTITPDGLTLGIGINLQYTATATYSDGSSQDLASGVTWSSSSSSMVSINSAGLATTVGAGQATITATVGSVSDTSTLTVVPAHLVSIAVTPQTSSIEQGTAQQFSAVGAFDDGSTQLLTAVTWSSSATNVASIDSAGVATGIGTGTATITAVSGSVTGTASLTVTAAQLLYIAVTPANSSMAAGTSKQFTATGTFSDNSTQDITASVLWSSSNPASVTINNQGSATSLATGTTVITASLGTVSGSTNLTVSSVQLIAIVISPSNPRIAKKTLIKFTATGTFSDGSTATNLSGLTWKSSKPNIASIRQSGLANGKKTGTVTISASSAGVTGTTILTIGSGVLVSIAITPVNPSVTLGGTQQFTATGSFDDGTSQDVTNTTHWSSSSASVATIANAPSVAGLATTWGVGTTVIGGNSGGVTASANLTVQ